VGRRFWSLTRHILEGRAAFDEKALTFDLTDPPRVDVAAGRYHLISKADPGEPRDGAAEAGRYLYRLSHPLGEFVLEQGKASEAPAAEIVFDLSRHPTRLVALEGLRGQCGWLTLTRLAVESYETEEYLLFSGYTDEHGPLDQETIERLFLCGGRVLADVEVPGVVADRLGAESERHTKGALSRSLEENSRHFQEAREKLEQWADAMVLAAEKALADTKERIKVLRREARRAVTLQEQHDVQEEMRKLERQQRKQRQEIFQVEDEIMEKRDQLIDALERRLAQRTDTERLFTIRWTVA
jgi:hypothetical protein